MIIIPSTSLSNVEVSKVGSKSLIGTKSQFGKPATPVLSVPTGPLRAVKIRPTSNLISPKKDIIQSGSHHSYKVHV